MFGPRGISIERGLVLGRRREDVAVLDDLGSRRGRRAASAAESSRGSEITPVSIEAAATAGEQR